MLLGAWRYCKQWEQHPAGLCCTSEMIWLRDHCASTPWNGALSSTKHSFETRCCMRCSLQGPIYTGHVGIFFDKNAVQVFFGMRQSWRSNHTLGLIVLPQPIFATLQRKQPVQRSAKILEKENKSLAVSELDLECQGRSTSCHDTYILCGFLFGR